MKRLIEKVNNSFILSRKLNFKYTAVLWIWIRIRMFWASRIRIWIRTKMSRIHNTDIQLLSRCKRSSTVPYLKEGDSRCDQTQPK
jgi:hypothetical protein